MTKTVLLAGAALLALGVGAANAGVHDNDGNFNDTWGDAINGDQNDNNDQSSNNDGNGNNTYGDAVNGDNNDNNDVNSRNDGNGNKIDDGSNGVIGQDNDYNVIDSIYIDVYVSKRTTVKSDADLYGNVSGNKVKAEADAGDGNWSDYNDARAKVHNGGIEVKHNTVIGGVLQVQAVNGFNNLGQQNLNITANGSFNGNSAGCGC